MPAIHQGSYVGSEALDYEAFAGFAPEPLQDLWEPEDDEYRTYDRYKEEQDDY